MEAFGVGALTGRMAKLLAINPARALQGERLAAAVNLNPAVKQ